MRRAVGADAVGSGVHGGAWPDETAGGWPRTGRDRLAATPVTAPVPPPCRLSRPLRRQGPRRDPNAAIVIVAGMLGVSAMAVQNALGADLAARGAVHGGDDDQRHTAHNGSRRNAARARSGRRASARSRAKHTWPAIVGFTVGCGLGAAFQAVVGLGPGAARRPGPSRAGDVPEVIALAKREQGEEHWSEEFGDDDN